MLIGICFCFTNFVGFFKVSILRVGSLYITSMFAYTKLLVFPLGNENNFNIFPNVVAIIELSENEENQVTRDIVENWSVEEQALEMDLSILQQVEDLERRVHSASLQVKVKLALNKIIFRIMEINSINHCLC